MNLTTVDDALSICDCRVDTNTCTKACAQTHTHIQCVTQQGLHLSRWREPPTHCQLLYNMYCITAESNRPPPGVWRSNTHIQSFTYRYGQQTQRCSLSPCKHTHTETWWTFLSSLETLFF